MFKLRLIFDAILVPTWLHFGRILDVLGGSGRLLGPSRRRLGGVVGRLGGISGRLGGGLGASGGVLGTPGARPSCVSKAPGRGMQGRPPPFEQQSTTDRSAGDFVFGS